VKQAGPLDSLRPTTHISIGIAALLASCSLYLPIRVKNTSDATITLTYKIQPLGWGGLLHEEAFIVGENRKDTSASVMMNRTDSVITLTLQPGDEAILGEGQAGPKDRLLADGTAANCPQWDRHCMNLFWMHITQNGVEHAYTSEDLLKALKKRKIPLTLITDEAPK
jgi:hypothetical protein